MAALVATSNSPAMDLTEMMKARRTEALPKNSLFGSTLEVHDEKEMEKIRALDSKATKKPRRRSGKRLLPEPYKSLFKAPKYVEKTKDDLEKQKAEVQKTQSVIDAMENDALQFKPSAYDHIPRVPATGRTIIPPHVIELTRDMNRVGLNERNSFNYDKYGKKPETHQYSLAGDVLRPGMDFTGRRERTECDLPLGDLNENSLLSPRNKSQSARNPSPHSVVRLPPNIRHRFGSRVCDNLLSDPKKVEDTITEQKNVKHQLLRASVPIDVPKMENKLKPEYEMLGNAMRMNIFPGYTMNHKNSTTKTSYTDSVHLRRYPDPDQWRYQRDELSTWAEYNVIDQQMRKLWQEYTSSVPKVQANWTRNRGDADKHKPAKPPPQPKAKTKNTKKPAPAKPKEEPAFEDVIFTTPPVTPPPEKVTLKPKKERDKEFWDEYDKGL